MAEARTGGNGCRVCGNESGNVLHAAREMFFGTRHPFTYVECSACGTLQLREVPDLHPYYADDYYSFRPSGDAGGSSSSPGFKKRLASFIRARAGGYYCGRRGALGEYRRPLGRLFARRAARIVHGFPDYLKDTRLGLGLRRDSAILDVGAGAGATLLALRHFGFRDLTGVDPFLETDISYPNGVRVLKAELADLDRQFDLILANHSVEHVPDPRAALGAMHCLLKPGRYVVVRIPVVAEAWREYGTDWVQLDPPRHIHLFTPRTFTALAEESGLKAAEIAYDSTAFQFWGSEQYRRDIPLMDERSYFVSPANSPFTPEQVSAYAARAADLNARGEGDQAVFYLRKS